MDLFEEDNGDILESFATHLTRIDEFANVVLKGHLLVEQDLDEAVSTIFFHPKHVLNGRIRFETKVQIARAMSLRSDDLPAWDLMLALNSLRNTIAHKSEEDEREKKIERLRQACLASANSKFKQLHQNEADTQMVVFACALILGFLAHYTEGIKNLRGHIDEIDTRLNPEEKRVSV